MNVEVLTVAHERLDLRDAAAVLRWVTNAAPDMIFMAAARVGGIDANARFPADFIYDNLAIELAIIKAAATARVPKLMMLGSSCFYPKLASQPISEEALLTGAIEETNIWYAVAKIAGVKMAEAYRLQHGLDFISAIPTSLYGPHDRFDESRGHVIPALISKVRRAIASGLREVEVWGSGSPQREFLHVDDCADALVFLAERYSDRAPINVGSGFEITIKDLAERICRLAGFDGTLRFDATRPDGVLRKRIDTRRLEAMGWYPSIDFDDGLRQTYEWFNRERPQGSAVAEASLYC
jgi:GDP-L-fucose synthase